MNKMFMDYINYVFKHLVRRRLRSWLTLLGIFIGMAAVVSLFSLSQGLKDTITGQFQSVGGNRIIIEPGGTMAGPFSSSLSSSKLYDKDLNVIKNVRGVDFSAGLATSISPIFFKDELQQGYIIGVKTDTTTINNIKEMGVLNLDEGRLFNSNSRYETIIGNRVAKKFFSRNLTTRDSLMIQGKKFKIIGIQTTGGVGFSPMGIFIPEVTSKEFFNKDNYGFVPVKVADGFNPEEVAERIKQKLRHSRNEKPGEETFTVQTANQVIDSFSKILSIVQVLIIGVAAISLIVGGVGIMNTMYTAVAERTREIGIMKAIGAKNSSIMEIFLLESGGLGFTGGAIGVLLGLLISKSVEIIANQQLGGKLLKAHISFSLVFGVLMFAFVLGALAGYFPAKRASKMEPVEALRK